jgi:hypothetical protein
MSRAKGSDGTMSIVSRIRRSRESGVPKTSAKRFRTWYTVVNRSRIGDKPPMLALRRLGLDDVVVEVIGAVAWGYGEQLRPRGVHKNAPQPTDFRRDMDWHGAKLTLPLRLVQPEIVL